MHHRAPCRRTALTVAALSLAATAAFGQTASPVSVAQATRMLEEARARQPLGFEPNHGQAPASAAFVARGAGYRLSVLRDGSFEQTLDDAHERSRMTLAGARRSRPVAEHPLAATSSYPGMTPDPVPAYERVTFHGVYPGIDAVYRGHGSDLEYDFQVAPGADARAIRLRFPDAKHLDIADGSGVLLVTEASGRVVHHSRPDIYQQVGDDRRHTTGRFRLLSPHTVGFALGPYDHTRTLIIDPTVTTTLTRFLSGNKSDRAVAIAVDSAGNTYITGTTNSTTGFPSGGTTSVNLGAKDCNYWASPNGLAPFDTSGDRCPVSAYVVKLDTAGTIVATVWFGGVGNTTPAALAVDDYYVYVAGGTDSPVVTTAQNQQAYVTYSYGTPATSTYPRAFLAKFTTPLTSLAQVITLSASGGSTAKALYVDHESTYLAGLACGMGFPTTPGVLQASIKGTCDGFVTKLDPLGTLTGQYGSVYSTLLGGTDSDTANAIAVDAVGDAWVTGQTCSADFPATPGLSHGTPSSQLQVCTAFLTELLPTGNAYLHSMYFGTIATANLHGLGDTATSLVLDASGGAYVSGFTSSSAFYMTRDAGRGAVQPSRPNTGYNQTGFVVYLDANFLMRSSTYFGSGGETQLHALTRNAHGDLYVGGITSTTGGLPGAPAIAVDPDAGFVSKLSPTLDTLGWTQMLGLGVTGAVARNTAVTGTIWTTGDRYTPGSVNPDNSKGYLDAFLVKLNDPIVYTIPTPPPVCRICIGDLQ